MPVITQSNTNHSHYTNGWNQWQLQNFLFFYHINIKWKVIINIHGRSIMEIKCLQWNEIWGWYDDGGGWGWRVLYVGMRLYWYKLYDQEFIYKGTLLYLHSTLHKRCENCENGIFFTVEAKHWKNVHFDLYNKHICIWKEYIFHTIK